MCFVNNEINTRKKYYCNRVQQILDMHQHLKYYQKNQKLHSTQKQEVPKEQILRIKYLNPL